MTKAYKRCLTFSYNEDCVIVRGICQGDVIRLFQLIVTSNILISLTIQFKHAKSHPIWLKLYYFPLKIFSLKKEIQEFINYNSIFPPKFVTGTNIYPLTLNWSSNLILILVTRYREISVSRFCHRFIEAFLSFKNIRYATVLLSLVILTMKSVYFHPSLPVLVQIVYPLFIRSTTTTYTHYHVIATLNVLLGFPSILLTLSVSMYHSLNILFSNKFVL